MGTTISIANTEALTCANAIADSVDSGTTDATGEIRIYDGTPPTNVDTALSGNNQLVSILVQNPAFDAAADIAPGARVTLLGVPLSGTAGATGTASFFRFMDRNNVARIQGTVGTSGEALNLNTVSIVTSVTVTITSFTITVPEA